MASGEFCGWLDVASGKRVVCEEAAAFGRKKKARCKGKKSYELT